MGKVIWEGKTAQGTSLRIVDRSTERKIHFEAIGEDGKVLADRHATPDKKGRYELKSNLKKFEPALCAVATESKKPNEGIGSALVALALGKIAERKGSEAVMPDVRNFFWNRRLVLALGGKQDNSIFHPFNVRWPKEKLTLPAEGAQPWHAYLPRQSQPLARPERIIRK